MIPVRNKRRSANQTTFVALIVAFSLPVVCANQADLAESSASDGSLSCPLHEGLTTFVVPLPTGSQRDCLTFVNENAAARGELKISVSDHKLAASDPKWTAVDGTVVFNHKRLFNLSMVGVEAKYVKLSFQVEKNDQIAALGW